MVILALVCDNRQKRSAVKSQLKLIALTTLGAALGVTATLFLTNPTAIGPLGVTIWFLGLLVAGGGLFTLILYYFKSFLHLHHSDWHRFHFAWRQGLLLAMALAIFLALSSLRQLSRGDIVLVSILLLLVEFYFRTRS